jgi:hypothetical protein
VPALLEDAIVDHEDDDDDYNNSDDDEESIDECLVEEDGFDNNIDNQLEDLDLHAAKWRAYIVKKGADIGTSFAGEELKNEYVGWLASEEE